MAGKWSEEELNYLIKNYNDKDISEICKVLEGRSKPAIVQRVSILRQEGKMGLSYHQWTEYEEDFIIDNYDKMKAAEMAKILGVTKEVIYYKRQRMRDEGLITTEIYTKQRDLKLQAMDERKRKTIELREERKAKDRRIARDKEEAEKRKLIEERQKARDKIYKEKFRKELAEEEKRRSCRNVKKTLGIKLEKDKRYKLENMVVNENEVKQKAFIGRLVQSTHNHITFINKNNIRESFLRKDIIRGAINIEEV